MHFFKRNFILIFLIISSIAMGVLAFVTALRLREFRQTPQQVSALTPTCKLTFTITDTTPREELAGEEEKTTTPTPPLFAQLAVTPTITLVPTVTPALKPTAATKPTAILTPSPTPTKTITPTKVAEPNLPVSGTNLPTMGALLLGIVLIGMGIFSGGFLFLSGK